ncbi:MAG: hypothetical protein CSA66_01180 [Proteobacteria bacterium]|nr:MAG: hypothetical protein CSA66_01180 [Pseudomonadota bacterium]
MISFNRTKLRACFAGLLAAGLVACHDGADGQSHGTVLDADADAAADTGAADVELDSSLRDTAADAVAPEDTISDTAAPRPAEVGYPCEDAADCNSSWCIEGRDGRVCSKACTNDCPLGWECRQNVAAFPDVAFICMPPAPTLCRPCAANADCVVAYDNTPHACVPQGDEGAFCGAACVVDQDCPPDYFCSAVLDAAGAPTRQCQPASGECVCYGGAIGASTTCSVSNGFGSCRGLRTCEAEGLTACDAATPALDACDAVDNNCDGVTDEAFLAEPCVETNTFGSCHGVTSCGPDGLACDAPIPPIPQAERCGDDADNDCDGAFDEQGAEGCTDHWFDADGDGVGVGEPRCLCGPDGFHTAPVAGDCDDSVRKVHPNADELCNGVDDDCDEAVDEVGARGCTTYHRDGDGDGFGAPGDALCLCAPAAPYTARNATDCDDSAPTTNPASGERCDGADNDCDGATDEQGAAGCALYFSDDDGDGFGDPADFACLCAAADPYLTARGGDCDDAPPGGAANNPGLPEACGDGIDNDCDGLTDEPGAEDCTPWFRDADGDTWGLSGDSLCLCAPVGEHTATRGGDCNDNEAAAHPEAPERCDGVDNDCDAFVDEAGAADCEDRYADRDRDGHGVDEAQCLCEAAIPYTAATVDDCDDTNPFINPRGAEVCNGLDDDCNGDIDEGVSGQCSPFYRDVDHDGWGLAEDSLCLCGPDGDHTAIKPGDCDDDAAAVYPFAQELCNGGVDDDCDGATDEQDALGCTVYFLDGDGDGAGLPGASRCLCAPDAGLGYNALSAGDCDDTDAAVHPGAVEGCNGGVDDDCDGATDEAGAEGCAPYLRDTDGDGWGVALDTQCLCAPAGYYTATEAGDCDDIHGDINPGVAEVCDGADNDCNGVADDPDLPTCTTYYKDVDGDGFGVTHDALCLCAPIGTWTSPSAVSPRGPAATTAPSAAAAVPAPPARSATSAPRSPTSAVSSPSSACPWRASAGAATRPAPRAPPPAAPSATTGACARGAAPAPTTG